MPAHPLSRPAALLVALSLLGAAACSDDDAAPAASEETTASADALPAGAEDLVGRWAHFDVVAYDDPLMNNLIISTGFADIELRDGELWNTQRFCHADTANELGIEVVMPDEATQAIVPVDVELEVSEEPDGRLRVVRPPTPTPIGIDLEDPANTPLPTDPNDPRITDDDGDGNPGVSARLILGEDLEGDLYIARREIFSYDVVQVDDDRFEGTITDDSEQLIIGASDPMLMTESAWVQNPDPERNPVIWIRVDDSWDCDRLAAERDELFPPNPEVDW